MNPSKPNRRSIRLRGWDYRAVGYYFLTWQRGYWERIIRNDRELNAIRKYIQENPLRWSEDRDNLDKLLSKMRYVDGV